MTSILVVDDNDFVRSAVGRTLEQAGFDVVGVANGDAGLRHYLRARPDLVITDLFMPDHEGIGMILEIRRHDPEARILAMSGGGDLLGLEILGAAEKLGAMLSIAKPFENEELLDKVHRCLADAGPSG